MILTVGLNAVNLGCVLITIFLYINGFFYYSGAINNQFKQGDFIMEETTAVIDTAAQTTQNAATAGDWWGMLLYCVIIFAIIYIFMVRPNKKRMAEYQKWWIHYRLVIVFWQPEFMVR